MNDYEIQKIRDTAFCSGYNTAVSKYENKIAELERKLEQTEKDLADYQFNYPTIKELQKELDYQKQARSIAENAVVDLTKENAELKDNFKIAKDNEYEYLSLLTKAKEIIKGLLSYEQIPRDCLKERYRKLLEEAEQFLNEVEK